MKLAIRDADLEKDREELIQFLYENLTKDSDGLRFAWLYLQNPCGVARVWVAVDLDSGRTVGVAAAFPRTFHVAGTERRVWVLGDFCFSNQSRSLGPALQLQRTCIGSLEGDPWYDFPSRSMMAVYKRIGIPAVGEVVRYAKLLRIDGKIGDIVSSKSVARAVSAAGNTLLRVRPRIRVPAELELSLFDGEFGEEFDVFNGRVLGKNNIQGIRTAEFLNWRYRKHFSQNFIVVVAKRRRELLGYAVIGVQKPEAILSDVQAADERTIPVMLEFVSELLIESRVNTLSAPMMANATLTECLRSAGFRPREGSSVVAYRMEPAGCLLLAGDRDS